MPAPPDDHVTPASLVAQVRRRIAEAGDPGRAPQMQAYMKSTMPFRGVLAKPLATLCKEVFDASPLPDRDAWQAAVLGLWDDAEFREERYAAIALTGHRRYRGHQDVAALALYRHLVETGAWWDYVDQVASNRVGPILRADRDAVTPIVRAWAEDADLWVRRTAILAQLRSKAATDTALLEHALVRNLEGSRHGSDFFIRKAIGWALREHARTDQAWVRRFVAEHEQALAPLSRREALKHVGS